MPKRANGEEIPQNEQKSAELSTCPHCGACLHCGAVKQVEQVVPLTPSQPTTPAIRDPIYTGPQPWDVQPWVRWGMPFQQTN